MGRIITFLILYTSYCGEPSLGAYDEYDQHQTVSMEDLRARMNRYPKVGIPLLCSMVLFLPVMLVLPRQIAESIFITGLLLVGILSISGAILLAIGSIWKEYIYAIGILQRVGPPEPTITARFAAVKIGNTYVFVRQRAPGLLCFVSFKYLDEQAAYKVKLPRVFWKWSSSVKIEGLRAHDASGQFSIPTPEGTIVTGNGYLLAVPILGSSYFLHVPEFSRQQLLAVADYASLLADSESAHY